MEVTALLGPGECGLRICLIDETELLASLLAGLAGIGCCTTDTSDSSALYSCCSSALRSSSTRRSSRCLWKAAGYRCRLTGRTVSMGEASLSWPELVSSHHLRCGGRWGSALLSTAGAISCTTGDTDCCCCVKGDCRTGDPEIETRRISFSSCFSCDSGSTDDCECESARCSDGDIADRCELTDCCTHCRVEMIFCPTSL